MNRFKKRRVLKELSQEEFALLIGVSQSAVTKWETGKTNPRAELLPKIAKVLNCTIDELLCSEDEKGVKDDS